MIKLFVFNRN